MEGQPADPELRKSWGWWKVKKWTVHILNRLYTRYIDALMLFGSDQLWLASSIDLTFIFVFYSSLSTSVFFFFFRFGDLKLQNPDNKAFAQMFQKGYAGKILECHLNLLNVIRSGGYLPDRVINLILQYLSNRFVRQFCLLTLKISHIYHLQLLIELSHLGICLYIGGKALGF